MNELSIHKIADLQFHVDHRGTLKVPIRGFDRIYDIALQALPGNSPYYFKEHMKAKNPYLSKYGEIWVNKPKSSTAMYKFCCITDLIRFMMNEADKLMKGSVHEDYLFIFHNALVLITAKENNQLDGKERFLTSVVASPQWTAGWNSLRRRYC